MEIKITAEQWDAVLLRLQTLENKVNKLEQEQELGGVIVDGAPGYVKDIYQKLTKGDR